MQITSNGLNEILSLGFFKPSTKYPGLFYLYSWKGLHYFGGALLTCSLKENEVFIQLTPKQMASLPKKHQSKEGNFNFGQIPDFFSESLFLVKENNSFQTKFHKGENKSLKTLIIPLEHASPFKIVYDTKKPFHGFYSPYEPFAQILKNLNFDLDQLWITAYPILDKSNEIYGVLAGITSKQNYGSDILELFKKETKMIYTAA